MVLNNFKATVATLNTIRTLSEARLSLSANLRNENQLDLITFATFCTAVIVSNDAFVVQTICCCSKVLKVKGKTLAKSFIPNNYLLIFFYRGKFLFKKTLKTISYQRQTFSWVNSSVSASYLITKKEHETFQLSLIDIQNGHS